MTYKEYEILSKALEELKRSIYTSINKYNDGMKKDLEEHYKKLNEEIEKIK